MSCHAMPCHAILASLFGFWFVQQATKQHNTTQYLRSHSRCRGRSTDGKKKKKESRCMHSEFPCVRRINRMANLIHSRRSFSRRNESAIVVVVAAAAASTETETVGGSVLNQRTTDVDANMHRRHDVDTTDCLVSPNFLSFLFRFHISSFRWVNG
jgi:hypothetical protein